MQVGGVAQQCRTRRAPGIESDNESRLGASHALGRLAPLTLQRADLHVRAAQRRVRRRCVPVQASVAAPQRQARKCIVEQGLLAPQRDQQRANFRNAPSARFGTAGRTDVRGGRLVPGAAQRSYTKAPVGRHPGFGNRVIVTITAGDRCEQGFDLARVDRARLRRRQPGNKRGWLHGPRA